MEATHVEALRAEIDRLRNEVTELRASRERFVLAVDAEQSRIERSLHAGVQQRLVALAVSVQLAEPMVDGSKDLFDGMRRDLRQALDDAAALAERICPALLDDGGLAVALRAAAVRAGIAASVDVVAGGSYPSHLARTVYWCWLESLEHGGRQAVHAITVVEEANQLVFVVDRSDSPRAPEPHLDWLRERVEALGGVLTLERVDGGISVRGELPLAR